MNTVEDAIAAIENGEFVIVIDDYDRENEGDLILAAEKASPEAIAFMVQHTSGLICVGMKGESLDLLDLPLMVHHNTEEQKTAFTVSVDFGKGTTTGISASDRAATIKALSDEMAEPLDFKRPGHVFPLRAREGGVLKRAGHTEAAVDLACLAGLKPAGALCEIVNPDGSMARQADLEAFAKKHKLVMISIADLIRYRLRSEKLVRRFSEARIPTRYGDFTAYVYESSLDGIQHLAFVKGDLSSHKDPLIRVHSECLTGDVFGSLRCDCGNQLDLALKKISEFGTGALVYLRGHEGRGIGLGHKLRAYNLQDQGLDTVEANLELGFPADSREYGIGAQILMDLKVTSMQLLTNNPAKYGGLEGYDLTITKRVPLHIKANKENEQYLLTKQKKMGHLLEVG